MYSEDKPIINTKRYAAYQRMVSEAGDFAIHEAKAAGLPLTYVEDNQIVKEYADGRKEILGTIKPPVKVTKRTMPYTGWGSGLCRAFNEQPDMELANDITGDQVIVTFPRR